MSETLVTTLRAANGPPGNLKGPLEFLAPEGGGRFILRLNPEDPSLLQLVDSVDERVLISRALDEIEKVVVQGSDSGDDLLTVDLTSPFFLTGGIEYHGGDGWFDTLAIEGDALGAAEYVFTGPQSGTIELDGLHISYFGLEPVNVGTATDAVFSLTAGADQAILYAHPTLPGRMVLESTNGGFERIEFDNPTGSLTINGIGGNDTILVESLSPTFAVPLTVDGGPGDDEIAFSVSGAVTPTVTLRGGAETDTLRVVRGADLTLTNASITDGAGFSLTLGLFEDALISSRTLNATGFTDGFAVLVPIPDWTEQGPQEIGSSSTVVAPYPSAGAVEALAIHPFNDKIIFAGSVNGGVWRSTDGGAHWTPLTDQFPSLAISALAIHSHDADGVALSAATPLDKLIVFAGTGRHSSFGRDGGFATGLLRSRNGGNTWELLGNPGMAGLSISAIVAQRIGVEDVVIVGAEGKTVLERGGVSMSGTPDLTFTDTAPSDTIRRSAGNWITDGFAAGQVIRVTGDSPNDGTFTIKEIPVATPDLLVLEPSDILATEGPRGGLTVQAELTVRLVKDGGIFRSVDGGATFTRMPLVPDPVERVRPFDERVFPKGSVTDVVIDPGNTSRLYAAVRGGGVFRSDNGGLTWAPKNTGLALDTDGRDNDVNDLIDDAAEKADGVQRILLAVEQDPANPGNHLFASLIGVTGFQLGVFRSTNQADAWSLIGAVPPSPSATMRTPQVVGGVLQGGLTFLDTGPDTITRTRGSWIRDGFLINHRLTIEGSRLNNGTFTIRGVTHDTLTLDPADSLMGEPNSLMAAATATPIITFADVAGGDTIGRNVGDWMAEGFAVGHQLSIDNSGLNDNDLIERQFRVAGVTSLVLTLVRSDVARPETDNTLISISGSASAIAAPTVTQPQANRGRQGSIHFALAADEHGNAFIGGDRPAHIFWFNQATGEWDALINEARFRDEPAQSHADTRLLTFDRRGILWSEDDGGVYRLLNPVRPAAGRLTGNPDLTFTSATTVTRSGATTWAADGFARGQEIVIAGSDFNNGVFVVDSVAGATLTIVANENAQFFTNPARGDISVAGYPLPAFTGVISFVDAGPDRIEGPAAHNWVTAGFAAGQEVVVSGAGSNDGVYTIRGFPAANIIELDPADAVMGAPGVAGVTVRASRVWQSMNRGLGATEIFSVAYDPINNVIIAGTQDNGIIQQPYAANGSDDDRDGFVDEDDERLRWTDLPSGDGNTAQTLPVDTNGDGVFDEVIRFTMSNNITSLEKQTYDASGNIVVGSQRTRNFTVNATTDELEITAHDLRTGAGPLQVTSSGALPGGLNATQFYWAIRVNDNRLRLATSEENAAAGRHIDLTSIGSGTRQLIIHTSGTDNRVLLRSPLEHRRNFVVDSVAGHRLRVNNHGLSTGDGPFRVAATAPGTLPAGLTPDTLYWAIRVDENILRLAASPQDAAAGTDVAITTAGSGTRQLLLADFYFSSTEVNSSDVGATANSIQINSHGLSTGAGPFWVVPSRGGERPSGVREFLEYWVIKVNDNRIQLAENPGNAMTGTEVDIFDAGRGSSRLVARFTALDPVDERGFRSGYTPGLPYVINAVDPSRMAIGMTSVYLSRDLDPSAGGVFFDQLDTIQRVLRPVGVARAFSALAYGGMKGGIANPDILYAARRGEIFIRRPNAMTGNPGLTFADAGAADTITRASGDWHTDGFAVGQLITVTGTPGRTNDGTYRIARLTDTAGRAAGDVGAGVIAILTLDSAAFLTAQGPVTDVTVDAFSIETPPSATLISDIVLDPDDFDIAYAISESTVYKRTGPNTWVVISQQLRNFNLKSLEIQKTGATTVLLVGGVSGVFRAINPAPSVTWTELGRSLPNALVMDIDFVSRDAPAFGPLDQNEVLIVGTLGRGAWLIDQADALLSTPADISIVGTSGRDVIKIERRTSNASIVDIFVNSPATPVYSVAIQAINKIVIQGGGDNDDVTLDSTNGTLDFPGGIEFDGGAGTNQLILDGIKVFDVTTSTVGSVTTVTVHDTRGGIRQRASFQSATLDNNLVVATPVERARAILANALRALAAGATEELAVIGTSLPRVLSGATRAVEQPFEDPIRLARQTAENGVLDPGSGLERIIESGLNGFSLLDIGTSILTLADLQARLDALDTTPGNVSLDETTDRDGDGTPDAILQIQVVRHLTGEADLLVEARHEGGMIRLSGEFGVSFDLALNLTIGIESTAGVFIQTAGGVSSLVVTNLALEGNLEGSGQIGFLDVEVTEAVLTVDPSLTFTLVLQDPSGGNEIRIGEFTDALTGPATLTSLGTFSVTGSAADDLVLTAAVRVAALFPDGEQPFNLGDVRITATWADVTQPTQVAFTFSLGAAQELIAFLQTAADRVLEGFETLERIIGDFDQEIPFLNVSIDDIAGFIRSFKAQVLDPLRDPVRGTASFTTIQDLVSSLARGLNDQLAGTGINFDSATRELTYLLNFSQPFSTDEGALDFGFDFGGPASGLDFSTSPVINGSVGFTTRIGLDLDNLIAGDEFEDVFFLRDAQFNGALGVDFTNLNLDINVVGQSVSLNNGSLAMAVTLAINPSGADSNSDGKITLRELAGSSPADLLDITATGSLDANLPFTADLGTDILSGLGFQAEGDFTVVLHSDDVFGDDPLDVTITLDGSITVLGQSIEGVFTFSQTDLEGERVTIISGNPFTLNLFEGLAASPLLTASGNGTFVLTETGVLGEANAALTLNVPNLTNLTGTFGIRVNSTGTAFNSTLTVGPSTVTLNLPAGPYVQVSGTGVSATVGLSSFNQTLSGDFVFEQSGSGASRIVKFGVANVSATLTAGPLSLAVTNGFGGFLVKSGGVAGAVHVGSVTLAGVPGVSVSAVDVEVRINNTNMDIDDGAARPGPVQIDVNGVTTSFQYTGAYFRNYLSISGAADIDLAGFVTLGGRFSFERSDAVPSQFKVAAEDLHFELKAGSLSIASFDQGAGALVVSDAGVAGVATLQFEVGLLGIDGQISLELNTTTSAVNTTVNTPSGPTVINLSSTEYYRVCVDNGHIHLGSVVIPFSFTVQVNTAPDPDVVEFRNKSDNSLLVSIDADGNINTGLSIEDFARPGPFELVSMLRQLLVWITAFRDSDVFDVEIPLTGGKTLGELFDWSKLFLDRIYSEMVTIELQAPLIREGSAVSGSFSNAKFKIKLGAEGPFEFTLNGSYSSIDDLVAMLNAARPAALLPVVDAVVVPRVEARKNKDGILVLALTPTEIAKGTALNLVSIDSAISTRLGWGPVDSDESTTEAVGINDARYTFEEFFPKLAEILGFPGTVAYDPARQVYTFTVDYTRASGKALGIDTTVPFNFDLDLGPIADAQVSGSLNLHADVGFRFTLGYDLGAAEVPRLLSTTAVPVPSHGRISANANFSLFLDNQITPYNLVLPRDALTDSNSNVEMLAADLNRIFRATPRDPGNPSGPKLDQFVIAQKAGTGLAISVLNEEDRDNDGVLEPNEDTDQDGFLDPGEDLDGDGILDFGEDLNGDGDRDLQLGMINRLEARSLRTDVFAAEMGFGAEAFDQSFKTVSTSSVKGLFIEDVLMEAQVEITTDVTDPAPNGIDGSLRFGFVEISTTDGSFGTLEYDGVTPNPIRADIALRDENTGETRFYISELFNGTSSVNILDMIHGPNFRGSFLARLDNIAVGGLGLSIPLGTDPEVSVWIPDINDLEFNEYPYDGSNTGIFVTYPDLGNLQNFTNLSFTQVIRALNTIADSLSQLSAFSFLDEKLPLIDVSVNDLLDYAQKFADLVEAASGSPGSSIQETIAELETQIEELFDLDPGILRVTVDDFDISSGELRTTSGVNGVTASSTTITPRGPNNDFIVQTNAANLANAADFNGSTIRIEGDSGLSDNTARASWDQDGKLLTVKIAAGTTTAGVIVNAINAIPGGPWTASVTPGADEGIPNGGGGLVFTTAIKFEFAFTTGYANSLPFQLDLNKLVEQLAGENDAIAAFLDAATTLVQIEGSGVLTVTASADLSLDFGLDITNPSTVTPFFYDSTGVTLKAKVLGTNLDIELSLGSIVGIFIKGGQVTIDRDGNPETNAGGDDDDGPNPVDDGAEFRLGLRDNNGDGRHYFSEDWFNFDNIDLHLTGGISARLPIFAPTESLPLGGDTDADGNGFVDNELVIDIPDLVRFLIDTRAENGVATVLLPGANNNLRITAPVTGSKNYEVVFVETDSLGTAANASFANNRLTIQINSDSTTAQAVQSAVQGSVAGFTVTFIDEDPSGTNAGGGTVTTSKLAIITPDFTQLFADLDLCAIIDTGAKVFLDGLDSFLGTVEEGINDLVGGTELPLVGDGLSGAANFISDFRNGLLAELRRAIDAAGGSAITAIENLIKEAIWKSLGPDGLDLLVDSDTGEALDSALGYGQLDVTLDCDSGLVVNVRIKKEVALVDTSQNPIDFDIGVPGFGLEVEGNVKVAIGFDLKFGVGLNAEDGFFFNSSAGADDPELRVFFEATIPGLTAAGELLFLQLQVADDANDPSHFTGQFAVDLKDPNGDGKLTFAEITSSGTQFDDIIEAQLGAEAEVNLDLIGSFGGNTAFPRVLADFSLHWMFDLESGIGAPDIRFENIRLDVGTFLSDFLGPILKEIRKVTEPIQPIIDIVTARLPILSDLAGETVTLLDLAETFGLLEPSTVDFIDGVIQVINLINKLEGLGEGTILIPFGSFQLHEDANGEMRGIQVLDQLAATDFAGALSAATEGPGTSSTYMSSVSGFAGDVGSLSNFSIPIFDNPSELFNLFTGEPVRLIEWRMPAFLFEFTYVQRIPIYPPLYAQFGGSIGAEINIGFGYDTFGIQKFISSETKNALDLFDGFHVLDFDANGNERPELKLTGEIFAGASINLLIAEVGVRGGVTATIEFDLNDVNDDGRVRVSEIIANAQQDPRCIFDIHGELGLFLEAFLIIDLFFFSIDKTWRFGEFTLFEFDITCPEPVLAEQTGTELRINIGSRAVQREEIDTNDNAETFVVAHTGGSAGSENVEVQWGSFKKEFLGIARIIVEDAGKGDDVIDVRGVKAMVEIHGGVGNDTIYLSDGASSKAYGDDGNDTIIASMETSATGVILYGGEGNDTLTGGVVTIEIHGGGGNDVITGSPQLDMLFGDAGADSIAALEGDDTAEGGDGNDSIDGGEGNDTLGGGGGADKLFGRRGADILEGGSGDDELSGSADSDFLVGGDGNDKAFGHGGIDLLIGDNYSTVNGVTVTAANIVSSLEDIGANGVAVEGITGAGDDFLVGGGNIDALFGGNGNDFLYGGNFFNAGETEVIEEDHNDFFDGAAGNDTIFGDDALGRTGDRNTGIFIKSSIWVDDNLNGLRDEAEKGFAGVTVQLFKQSQLPLTPGDPPTGSPVATEQTGADGSFEFPGLDPGDYFMIFSEPADMDFAPRYQGGATTAEGADNDNDADPNPGATRGWTDVFNLDFNETEDNVSAGYLGPARVSIANASVDEGSAGETTLSFVVELSRPQGAPVEIVYRTDPLTAFATGGDYTAVPLTTLVINPGELSATIAVIVLGDTTYEEHEQFVLSLTRVQRMDPVPLNLDHDTNILGTIFNDDPIPTISISDFVPTRDLRQPTTSSDSVGLPTPEATMASFFVTLSNPSAFPISVDYRTDAALNFRAESPEDAARPSPLAGADFTSKPDTTITFAPGETNKRIDVTLSADTLDEHDEQFFVDLFNPVRARIADNRGIGIIPDDDEPVSVTIVPMSPAALPGEPFKTRILEGNSGSKEVTLEVRLSSASGKTVTVTYGASPGTAVQSVPSASGDLLDYIGEPDGDALTDELQQLVFAPGEVTKTITIHVLGDNRAEPSEIFFVNILSAENADIARATPAESNHVTIEIEDDDTATPGADYGPWSIYFAQKMYFVDEPNTGTVTVPVTILRTPGSSHAVAVFYTEGGTAAAGADYAPIFRQIVQFADGEVEKTVEITIPSDATPENNETILLWLNDPTGGPVNAAPDESQIVIVDDERPEISITPPVLQTIIVPLIGSDPPITIPFTIFGVTEGSGGGFTNATFNVHANPAPGPGGAFVRYQTVNLTARGPADYNTTQGILFIPPGVSDVPLTVQVRRDNDAEVTERFAVQLFEPTGAVLAPKQSAAISPIFDDDPRNVAGVVFYDRNGNGFRDGNEAGIEGVDVTIKWFANGVEQSMVKTTNNSGVYDHNVFLGPVSITVDGATVQSPSGPSFLGSGEYELTTGNDNQTTEFEGVVGISPFADIGYQSTVSFSLPEETDDVGRGGTDDTIFGGPGNDYIDAGSGDDHVIGGHWMTATDTNTPVAKGNYDAHVIVVTDPVGAPDTLQPVYDEGPIFGVDTSGLNLGGIIRGQIWLDALGNNTREPGDPLFTEGEVLVTLFDCNGNPVNSVVSTNGLYEFNQLYVDDMGADSEYVVQFDLPNGYRFVAFGPDSDVQVGNRTTRVTINQAAPVAAGVDAGARASDTVTGSLWTGFRFADPSFNASEADRSGKVTITVVRGNSFRGASVVVRTQDGTATSPTNFTATMLLLYFDVGETSKSFDIAIHNTHSLQLCDDPLQFTLELRDPTGHPLDEAPVYIGGASAGTNPDDDTILGGENWDIILGDSGNIPAQASIDVSPEDISLNPADPWLPATSSLNGITYSGGPGKDDIHGNDGPDFINAQLGKDTISGDEGEDIIRAGLGDDSITVEIDDDAIDGEHGLDRVVSIRDVPTLFLENVTPLTGRLIHRNSVGAELSEFLLWRVETAKLLGGDLNSTFDINGWDGSAIVSGAGGTDALFVTNDTDMALTNSSLAESLLFEKSEGFRKDSALGLANGNSYHLGSLESVTLTGGASANNINASGYSRPVTFVGLGGNDTLIGGSAADTFLFAANSALGTDAITGNGGRDTIDLTPTTQPAVLRLNALTPTSQVVVAGNLALILNDKIENALGGSNNDNLVGNDLDNVLLGGPGDDRLEGGPGNETYAFDVDLVWGNETIVEAPGEGNDILDFSATTGVAVVVDLTITTGQVIFPGRLTLTVEAPLGGEGEIESVIGGSMNDRITGNNFANTLRSGPGADALNGAGGADFLDGGPGNDDLNGGPGMDTIDETADTNFWLSNAILMRGSGEVDTLANLEVAHLTGGPARANRFDLTGWTGSGSISGADDTDPTTLPPALVDTIILTADADFVLTNGSLQVTDALGTRSITLTGIEDAILTGGGLANTINASAFSGSTRISGSDGNDILTGGPRRDVILGGLGADTIRGNEGSDFLDGGGDNDTIIENRDAFRFIIQNDRLNIDLSPAPGDEQFDVLSNFEAAELIGGAAANVFDVTEWTAGPITLRGQSGLDAVAGRGAGAISLADDGLELGGVAVAVILDSVEVGSITGSDGDDVIDASHFSGVAVLQGGKGDDRLIAGMGSDFLNGGEGDDTFVFLTDATNDLDSVTAGDGDDALDFSNFTDPLTLNLSITGADQAAVTGKQQIRLTAVDVENVIGGSDADNLTGNPLDNTFTPGAGGGSLSGGGGTNTLVFSGDVDMTLTDPLLAVSTGNIALAGIQRAFLSGGEGDNTLNAAFFTGRVTLDGGAGADSLIGGFGSDELIGGSGVDQLVGGDGNDVYKFEVDSELDADSVADASGVDTFDFAESTAAGVTVNLATVGAAQTVNTSNLDLTIVAGTIIENVRGTSQGDTITGNAANNLIFANGGSDMVDGAGGLNALAEIRDEPGADGQPVNVEFRLTDAALTVSRGGVVENDTLQNIQQVALAGGAGNDTLDGSQFTAGPLLLFGQDGDDILAGGAGADLIIGGAGNDLLAGGDDNDELLGGDGLDQLAGGAGDDMLEGGNDSDTYIFDQTNVPPAPPINQGVDAVVEQPGGGSNDMLIGAGLSGIDIDLNLGGFQVLSAILTVIIQNPGVIENAF